VALDGIVDQATPAAPKHALFGKRKLEMEFVFSQRSMRWITYIERQSPQNEAIK